MRWLRTFSGRFAARARSTADYALSLVPNFFASVLWQIASTFPELARKAFGSNAVVYACLRLLSQSVAEPPLEACAEASDGELTPVPKTHPLQILLDRPNELMTGYEMLELVELHVGLAGASYWWKQRTNGGQVGALWPLRPDRVVAAYQPNMNAPEGERVLRGWAYFPPGGGSPIVLPRSEVLTFGTPDPAGETGGIVETLGWVQVLASEIAADNEATSFVGSLLANYAQPSMLIKTKAPIRDAETARRLKGQFMAELGGPHKGEPALLDADTTIEKLSFDLQQLEFPDVRAIAETRITAAAGTPAILVGVKAGLDKATYSNYEQAREFFTETTLANKWRRYGDQFTHDLAPDFGPGLVVRFDTSQVKALAGQRQRNAQPIKEGFERGVVFLDEYREKVLGLPPLPNGLGQVLYLPTNVKVIEAVDLLKKPEPPALPPPPPQNALPPPADPEDPEQEDDDPEAEDPAPPPPPSKAVRSVAGVEQRADATRDRHAETLTASVRTHLDQQRERVVSRWNETAKDWPSPDDLIGDDEELLSVVRDAWALVLGDAVEDAGAALGLTLSFELANDWVQQALDDVGARIKGITSTTRDDLKTIIGRAASEGMSIPDVAALIREAGAWSASRAETIALTETAVAYNRGSLRAYEESGLVDEVEVLDGKDFDETCKALHGQKKSLTWANANLIQHPRCRRAFAPLVRE